MKKKYSSRFLNFGAVVKIKEINQLWTKIKIKENNCFATGVNP